MLRGVFSTVSAFTGRVSGRILGLVAGLGLLAVLPNAVANPDLAEIMDIRHGVNQAGVTRIVIDLTDNADYRVETAYEDGRKQLIIDVSARALTIPSAIVEKGVSVGAGEGVGSAGDYSYRLVKAQDQRLHLTQHLTQSAVPSAVFILKPKGSVTHHRLVVDLKPATDSQFEKSVGKSFGSLS